MTRILRILLVEPSPIITEGISCLLQKSNLFEVCSTLSDADTLEERLTISKPDILLINPMLLPHTRPLVSLKVFRDFPKMAIVAIVYQYLEPALLHGFHGILDINESSNKISSILEAAYSSLEDKDDTEEYSLSSRETDVLIFIARGMTNKDIADELNISQHTVMSHRKNITKKTGIKSAAGLAVYAMLHNLI